MLLSIVVVEVGLEARVVVMGHPARVVGGSKEGVATVVLGVVGHGGRVSKGRVVVTEASAAAWVAREVSRAVVVERVASSSE